jgi:hypothetical protein
MTDLPTLAATIRELDAKATEEEWRQILDLPFEASSIGRVRRLGGSGKPLKQRLHLKGKRGRWVIRLTIPFTGGKQKHWIVSRAVATAFLGPIPDGMHVNHKDGNRRNNNISNLEIVTPAENMAHAVRTGLIPFGARNSNAKLNARLVRRIRSLARRGMQPAQIKRAVPALAALHSTTISHVIKGRHWTKVSS